MKFKRSGTQGIFIVGVIVLALVVACDTNASPLYGGYNGESKIWAEFYIVEETTIGFSLRVSIGTDTKNLWIRMGISSLFLIFSNISNIGVSYETGGILSLNVTTLSPPIKWGVDTNDLGWFIMDWLIVITGLDTDGNFWGEGRIPSIGAYGGDNNDNKWWWIKLRPVLMGMKVDLTSNQGSPISQENALRCEKELGFLQAHSVRKYSPKLSALLIEKVTNSEIMENMISLAEALSYRRALFPLKVLSLYENSKGIPPIDPSSGMPSELNVFLTYLEEEVFTDEVRDEMDIFLDAFAKDVQPQLEVLKDIGSAP